MMLHRAFSLFCLSACAAPARAAELSPPQSLPPEAANPAVQTAWIACNGDILRFCPDVQPGGGRIVHCLIANRSQLTPACIDGMLHARSALGR